MIIPATIDDIPVIRQLADICFRDTYQSILTPEQIDYMMEWMYGEVSLRQQLTVDGHVYFLCTDEDGTPEGYVSVQPQGAAEDGLPLWHLQKIYVLPHLKGKGRGVQLFHHALNYIHSQSGPSHVELNVNRANPAVGFYHKMGMAILRQGDFPIGQGYFMNDYIMGIDC